MDDKESLLKTNNQQKGLFCRFTILQSQLFLSSFFFAKPSKERKNRKTAVACNFSLIEDKGQNYASLRKKVETRNTHIFYIKKDLPCHYNKNANIISIPRIPNELLPNNLCIPRYLSIFQKRPFVNQGLFRYLQEYLLFLNLNL